MRNVAPNVLARTVRLLYVVAFKRTHLSVLPMLPINFKVFAVLSLVNILTSRVVVIVTVFHLILEMCSLAQEASELAGLYFYIKINCIVHKFSSFFFRRSSSSCSFSSFSFFSFSVSFLLLSLSFLFLLSKSSPFVSCAVGFSRTFSAFSIQSVSIRKRGCKTKSTSK